MTRALLFSGGGDYTDPWHPYPASSDELAEVLRGAGVDVEVEDSVDAALDALADGPELFALNAGAGPAPHARDAELAGAAIAHVEAGGTLLVLHLSIGLFPGDDDWEAMVGGRWIWEVSGHPPHGEFEVEPADGEPFRIADEAYAHLRRRPGSEVLATHRHGTDGEPHPLVWRRDHGAGRVVVDLLGHDAGSLAHPDHRALLLRALALPV